MLSEVKQTKGDILLLRNPSLCAAGCHGTLRRQRLEPVPGACTWSSTEQHAASALHCPITGRPPHSCLSRLPPFSPCLSLTACPVEPGICSSSLERCCLVTVVPQAVPLDVLAGWRRWVFSTCFFFFCLHFMVQLLGELGKPGIFLSVSPLSELVVIRQAVWTRRSVSHTACPLLTEQYCRGSQCILKSS